MKKSRTRKKARVETTNPSPIERAIADYYGDLTEEQIEEENAMETGLASTTAQLDFDAEG